VLDFFGMYISLGFSTDMKHMKIKQLIKLGAIEEFLIL